MELSTQSSFARRTRAINGLLLAEDAELSVSLKQHGDKNYKHHYHALDVKTKTLPFFKQGKTICHKRRSYNLRRNIGSFFLSFSR